MVHIFLPQLSVFILFLTKSYHFLCLNASINLAVEEIDKSINLAVEDIDKSIGIEASKED